jgi:hypothetical protein
MGTLGPTLALHRLAEGTAATQPAGGLRKIPDLALLEVLSAGQPVVFLAGSHLMTRATRFCSRSGK